MQIGTNLRSKLAPKQTLLKLNRLSKYPIMNNYISH